MHLHSRITAPKRRLAASTPPPCSRPTDTSVSLFLIQSDKESPPPYWGQPLIRVILRMPTENSTDLSHLLTDRSALAAFVMKHEQTIRAVARRKLHTGARTAYDSDDVLATVLRRVDHLAERSGIRATSEGEIISLILTIAEHASISRNRLAELARARMEEEAAFSQMLLAHLDACKDDEEAGCLLVRMFASLPDTDARTLFLLRLRGIEHKVIAQMLAISPEACRQRWKKIREELIERFAPDANEQKPSQAN